MQRGFVQQADTAQGNILQLGFEGSLAATGEAHAGIDPSAHVLALVDRLVNDVGCGLARGCGDVGCTHVQAPFLNVARVLEAR
ncbi:hypothetical protein D3C80_2034200 [compost metagenome]